jgi:hypothetical protein
MAKRKRRASPSTSRHGKTRKVSGKRSAKRPVAKKAKRSAKTAGKKLTRNARPAARPRNKKGVPTPTPQVETEIVDVIEEPIPGVVSITEVESTRVIIPDSDEENKE